MEENRLRDLSYFQCLRNLERLYLGMNRIQVSKINQLYSVVCNIVTLELANCDVILLGCTLYHIGMVLLGPHNLSFMKRQSSHVLFL